MVLYLEPIDRFSKRFQQVPRRTRRFSTFEGNVEKILSEVAEEPVFETKAFEITDPSATELLRMWVWKVAFDVL